MSDFSKHPAYSRLYAAPGADEPPAFFPEKIAHSDQEHLDQLEAQSVFLIREAFHHFKNICMPWSMGKDSNRNKDSNRSRGCNSSGRVDDSSGTAFGSPPAGGAARRS